MGTGSATSYSQGQAGLGLGTGWVRDRVRDRDRVRVRVWLDFNASRRNTTLIQLGANGSDGCETTPWDLTLALDPAPIPTPQALVLLF